MPDSVILEQESLGKFGVVITNNTSLVTGNFIGFKVLINAVFTSINFINSTGSLAGITINAGEEIAIPFTTYQLASGTIIAYKGKDYA
jgi:hypothetical protein